MANLKDIGYGIGKYLTVSDASSLPDITTNRTNIDLLNFKVATNNAYSLYNFKDGMIDAYQTEAGVDTGTSTYESYDSTNKVYTPYTNPGGNIDANTLIMLHMDGANAGTTFTDSSPSPYTITPTSATTVTAVKKFGTASYESNHTGWLSVDSSSALRLGCLTDSWTIEFWIYFDTYTNSFSMFDHRANAHADGGFSYWTNSASGGIGFDSSNGTTWAANLKDPNSITNDTWYHYAVVQEGGNRIVMYRDGTEVDTSTTLMCDTDPGTYVNWFIGGGYNWAGNHTFNVGFDGSMDEVRVSNVARFTSNFTPPILPYSTGSATENMTLVSNAQTAQADPTEGRLMLYEEDVDSITLDTDLKGYVSRDGGTTYTQTLLTEDTTYEYFNQGGIDANTLLMLHMDGTNGGTTFTDSSPAPYTVTPTNVTTNTSIKKLGTASSEYNLTGWLEPQSSTGFKLGNTSASWTIDFWIYFDTFTGSFTPMDHRANVQANGGFSFWTNSASGGLGFDSSNGSTWAANLKDPNSITNDTWYHYAVVQAPPNITMYRDGIAVDTSTTLMSDDTGTYINWFIGGGYNASGSHSNSAYLDGFMDELRVSNVARWTANFTPPSYAYTTGDAQTTQRLLSGSVDISGQPAGTDMKYKVETLNNKKLKLHGASLLWA